MVRSRLQHPLLLAVLLSGAFVCADAAETPAACGVASESCLQSCTRFDLGDVRRTACNNYCAKPAASCKQAAPRALETPKAEPAPEQEATPAANAPASAEQAKPDETESRSADEAKDADTPSVETPAAAESTPA